ncbi:MAG: hypothetical protein ILP11_02220 [Alphaproteobacteria bacterium]|nr:hypothetical protein [Alphaproteobacteria bacterium]
MKLSLIRIGNSQGVRIPAGVISQCGFKKVLEATVQNNALILQPADRQRHNWDVLVELEAQNTPFHEEGEWQW